MFMTSAIIRLLIIALLAGYFSDAQTNPSSYYRKIASEQRKLRTKQINYYKTALLKPDERRLLKGRDMILTQIELSIRNMKRMPAFKGDSALRNDYIRILDTYNEVYTTAFDSVQKMKDGAGKSAEALKAYTESIYYMEGLIDEAEDDWTLNEDYFVNAYNIRAMNDPTAAELSTLRNLNYYVQEMRGTYSSIPFKLREMQHVLKQKEYGDLEDQRQELGLAVDRALVAAAKVDVYIDEEEEEDDFLLNYTLRYLDELKEATDEDMADILTDLDNALYDEDEKKIDRYAFEMEDLLLDLIDLELDILDRTERFVSAYVDY
jgi:hypothetical protein